ncbi:MAG: hypothetical protein MJZ11_06840 [Lachnospiraceae bacterium]|nr:hypothetical protein [Lachnospiraceae bacterium]
MYEPELNFLTQFKLHRNRMILELKDEFTVLKDGSKIEQLSIETFMRKPRESMRMIAK